MRILKNKMWQLLNLLSIQPYLKIELINLLDMDLTEFLNLIMFINNYCNKTVVYIVDNIVYLDKNFIFFTEADFNYYDTSLNIEIVNSIDSTNDLLIRYVKDGININNKIIIANEQTKGKGRLDRKWVSSLGNSIIFSLGINFEKNKNIDKLIAISLVVSYSCVRILAKYDIPVQIKWPNDIVVKQLKLGGVLVNNINNGIDQSLVIGVGLNYNNNFVITSSTYIKKYSEIFAKNSLQEIIKEIYNNVYSFKENGFKTFKDKYLHYLRDINCDVDIIQNNNIRFQGKVLGVSDKGELIVQDNDNLLHYIVSGDLSLRTTIIK